MDGRGGRRAVATAPTHVTGFFAPALEARDPRGRGSIGAGIVLAAPVRATARFDPSGRSAVRMTSDVGRRLEISAEVAHRLVADRPGRLAIHLDHPLPLGQGFGTSAAGATATALATARLVDRSRRAAVQTAHLADLFGRGGLGGVSAILGGGLEIREHPGIPPFGRVAHVPVEGPLVVGIVGPPLPSPTILTNRRFLARIGDVPESVDRLRSRPTLDEFFRLSESFTDRVGLASAPLRATIRALRRRGAWAAQAMFGESFFARPRRPAARRAIWRWLESRPLRAVEIGAARSGARLIARSDRAPPEQAF